MDRAETAGAGLAAGSVVMLLMAVVVVGIPTAEPGEVCPGSNWLEHDGTCKWLSSFPEEVTTPSGHVLAATNLTWADLSEKADLELPKDGPPLPMLTCHMSNTSCQHTNISSIPRMMLRKRVLCMAVNGSCWAVIVTTREPKNCCCAMEVINATLSKPCPIFPKGTARGERTKGARGLGERRVEKEHSLSSEGSIAPSLQGELLDIDDHEELDNTTSSERVEDDGGLTEEQVKESTVLEDIIAALVFLFVGAVLVLIKSRVFRITKKKIQEEREVGSQETLVDETII